MNEIQCYPPICPLGASLREDIHEIKENQKETLNIISDNKMMLAEIKNLREDYKDIKANNQREHDTLFIKLNKKLDKSDAKWAIGVSLTIAGIIFTIINLFIKAVVK